MPGASCVPPTISCSIAADTPYLGSGGSIILTADTSCTDDVPEIDMEQTVTSSIPGNPMVDEDIQTDARFASTQNIAACQPGYYGVSASAFITSPGYTMIGANPIHDTSATVPFNELDCNPGGGGGGGGCATATPSSSAQPAVRRPDLIVCR